MEAQPAAAERAGEDTAAIQEGRAGSDTRSATAAAPIVSVRTGEEAVRHPQPVIPPPTPKPAEPRSATRTPAKAKREWNGPSAHYDGEVRLRAPRGTNDTLRTRGYNLEDDKAALEEKVAAVEAEQPETDAVRIVLRAEALYLGVIELPDAVVGLFPRDRTQFRLTSPMDRKGISVELDRKRYVLFNRQDLPNFLWAHDWPPGAILTLSRTGTVDEYELRARPMECIVRDVITFWPGERGEPQRRTDAEVHLSVQVDEDTYRSARRWEDFDLMAQPVDKGVVAAIVDVLERLAARGELIVNESALRHEVFAARRCSYASIAIALRERPKIFERVGPHGWRLLPPPERSRSSTSRQLAAPSVEAPAPAAAASQTDDSEPIVPWLNRASARISVWAERVDARLALTVLRPMLQQLGCLVQRLEDALPRPGRSDNEPPAVFPVPPAKASVGQESSDDALRALAEGVKALKKVSAVDPANAVTVLRRVAEAVGALHAPATAAVLYLLLARLEATTLGGIGDGTVSLRRAARYLQEASLRPPAATVDTVAQRVAQGMPWPRTAQRLGSNGEQVRDKGCRGAWWQATYSAQRKLFDTHLTEALALTDLL